MLKHIRDIRIAANRSYSWYKYDEQFRLRPISDHIRPNNVLRGDSQRVLAIINESNNQYTSE